MRAATGTQTTVCSAITSSSKVGTPVPYLVDGHSGAVGLVQAVHLDDGCGPDSSVLAQLVTGRTNVRPMMTRYAMAMTTSAATTVATGRPVPGRSRRLRGRA